MSLSTYKDAEIIEALKSRSRYLVDLLNIDNIYFDGMIKQIYPLELQLNKANSSDTEGPFLDLHLSISDDFVSSKIYDKCDDFDFHIVNFQFLDGDIPRATSYGIYISYSVCSSDSELVCCWVLVLFHLSDESWFICPLFWFTDE